MSNNYIFKTKQKSASLLLSNRVIIVYFFFYKFLKQLVQLKATGLPHPIFLLIYCNVFDRIPRWKSNLTGKCICQRRISPDSYVQWLCPPICSRIRLGDSFPCRIWSSINEPLLFCCIAVCWSDCTWVTPTTRESAMWDFGHLEAMSSLSLRILQNPWYQKACLLRSPPVSSCVSWSTRKRWECCQSLKEQMSDSFNSNILVSLNFAADSKHQHLLSWKWQYCFVHF